MIYGQQGLDRAGGSSFLNGFVQLLEGVPFDEAGEEGSALFIQFQQCWDESRRIYAATQRPHDVLRISLRRWKAGTERHVPTILLPEIAQMLGH